MYANVCASVCVCGNVIKAANDPPKAHICVDTRVRVADQPQPGSASTNAGTQNGPRTPSRRTQGPCRGRASSESQRTYAQASQRVSGAAKQQQHEEEEEQEQGEKVLLGVRTCPAVAAI